MKHTERQERRQSMAEMAKLSPIHEIAEHFGVSGGAVRYACREHNVTPFCEDDRQHSTLKILFKLLNGKPQVEVAKELKISRQRVHQVAVAARNEGFTV